MNEFSKYASRKLALNNLQSIDFSSAPNAPKTKVFNEVQTLNALLPKYQKNSNAINWTLYLLNKTFEQRSNTPSDNTKMHDQTIRTLIQELKLQLTNPSLVMELPAIHEHESQEQLFLKNVADLQLEIKKSQAPLSKDKKLTVAIDYLLEQTPKAHIKIPFDEMNLACHSLKSQTAILKKKSTADLLHRHKINLNKYLKQLIEYANSQNMIKTALKKLSSMEKIPQKIKTLADSIIQQINNKELIVIEPNYAKKLAHKIERLETRATRFEHFFSKRIQKEDYDDLYTFISLLNTIKEHSAQHNSSHSP